MLVHTRIYLLCAYILMHTNVECVQLYNVQFCKHEIACWCNIKNKKDSCCAYYTDYFSKLYLRLLVHVSIYQRN